MLVINSEGIVANFFVGNFVSIMVMGDSFMNTRCEQVKHNKVFFRSMLYISLALSVLFLSNYYSRMIKAEGPIEIRMPEEDYYLPEANSFNMIFTAETQAIPFSPAGNGTVWKKGHDFFGTTNIEGKASIFDFVSVNSSDFGKTGMVYTNVGNFEDRKVNLIVTIMNVSNNKPVGFSVENEISFLNDSFVDFKWSYVDALTYEPISISGYYSFADLDVNQEILLKDTSSITGMYKSDDNEHYTVNQVGDAIRISTFRPNLGTADKKGFISIIYTELPELNIIWNGTRNISADLIGFSNSTDESLFDLNASKNHSVDSVSHLSNIGYNNLFLFTQYQPAKTMLLTPTKSETHTDGQFIQYTIKHSLVYEEDILRKYEELSLVDVVDDKLEIISRPSDVCIKNENGEDKSSSFNVEIVGNTISIHAKVSELAKNDFYGHTYAYAFDTKIKQQYVEDLDDVYGIVNDVVVSRKVPYKSESDSNVSNSVVVDAAYVLARYIDGNGNQLVDKNGISLLDANPILQKGLVADTYTTSSKDFEGWRLKETPINKDGAFEVAQQEVLYVYERKLYNVYFVENGGTEVEDKFGLEYASLIPTSNTETSYDGKTFVGWYIDQELTIQWDFNSDIIEGDITLYGKWIDISVPLPNIPNTGMKSVTLEYLTILLLSILIISGTKLIRKTER